LHLPAHLPHNIRHSFALKAADWKFAPTLLNPKKRENSDFKLKFIANATPQPHKNVQIVFFISLASKRNQLDF